MDWRQWQKRRLSASRAFWPTPFISYDHYGIVNNEIRGNYYQNLEIISEEARKLGKPFWAFALSTAHGSYPVPNVAQLKLQMYSNLAYGAQGLQYFTYWNPGTETWNFHEAPITPEKKRSSVYDFVREVNAELQKRNFVFMRSKEEIDSLPPMQRAVFLSQTTRNAEVVAAIAKRLSERIPQFDNQAHVCPTVQKHQEAVRRLAQTCDAMLIIGSQHSANGRYLAELAGISTGHAQFVENAQQLKPESFENIQTNPFYLFYQRITPSGNGMPFNL